MDLNWLAVACSLLVTLSVPIVVGVWAWWDELRDSWRESRELQQARQPGEDQ